MLTALKYLVDMLDGKIKVIQLPELTIEEWLVIYNESPKDSEIKFYAQEVLLDLAGSDRGFLFVILKQTDKHSELNSKILEQLLDISETFEELLTVLARIDIDHPCRHLVLAKALEIARTTEQCLRIFKESNGDKYIQRQALRKTLQLTFCFDVCLDVWNKAEGNKELQKEALQKIKEFETLENWLRVLQAVAENTDLETLILKKITKYGDTFTVLQEIYRKAPIRSNFRREILSRMAKKAKSYDEYLIVLKDVNCQQEHYALYTRCETQKYIANKVLKLTLEFKQWYCLYVEINTEKDKRKLILEKMLQVAKSFGEFADTYNLAKINEDEIADKAFIRMLELGTIDQLHNRVPRSSLLNLFEAKISSFELDFEHWKSIWQSSDGIVERIAFKKMADSNQKFAVWQEIIHMNCKQLSSGQSSVIINNMITCASGFKEWFMIFKVAQQENQDLKDLIIEKMFYLAKSYQDWEICTHVVSPGSILRLNAIREMIKLTN